MAKKINQSDEKISVRMLRDSIVEGVQYLANQAVLFPANIAEFLVESGAADSAESAVEFVISEGAELVEHIVAALEETAETTEIEA